MGLMDSVPTVPYPIYVDSLLTRASLSGIHVLLRLPESGGLSCCHPVLGRCVTLQVASQPSIFFGFVLMPLFQKKKKEKANCYHTLSLFIQVLLIFFFFSFKERFLVVQFLCMYILIKGVKR